jgi:hypothetical protein
VRTHASAFAPQLWFVTVCCRYSYYSADDNALNESPLSLSQEKYNQLLGFTISAAIFAFFLAIGGAMIYSRARRRFALVAPTESDHPGRPAPSFWKWLWNDLTSKQLPPADETQAASLKQQEPFQGGNNFRRTAKKGYVQRATLTIESSVPPTPEAMATALQGSEYFRALAREEHERRERLAQIARDENEGLGLRLPPIVRVPLELPPSNGRRRRGAGQLPQAPALPRPY